MTTDIQNFDFAEEEHSQNEGLKQAHDLVTRAMRLSDDSLYYWSSLFTDQRTAQLLTPPSSSSHGSMKIDPDDDEDVVQAEIRQNLLDNGPSKIEEPPEQSSSPEEDRRPSRTESSSPKSRRYGDLRDHFHPVKRSSSAKVEGSNKRAKVEEGDVVDGDL